MATGSRAYLDYNASAPLLEEARSALLAAMERQANPSSVHTEGRASRAIIEHARAQLGRLVDAKPNQIVFTSGASEAASTALSPVVRAGGRDVEVSKLLVSAVEHPAILTGGRFDVSQVEIIPVLPSGLVDLEALERLIDAHDAQTGALMIAVQLANSETGIIQPIAEIAAKAHGAGAFLVVDAVQALGKIPVSIADLQAHFVIFSSHKIGGPQGAGALVYGDASISPRPMIRGGGQENFQRGGTENVAAIAGFGAACEVAEKRFATNDFENLTEKREFSSLRDYLEAELRTISQDSAVESGLFIVFGKDADRLPNTSAFAFAGVKAETALISLDLAGVSVSSGSACSSGKVKRSHVLEAMKTDEEFLGGAIRVSLGPETAEEEVRHFLDAWKSIVKRMAKAA